MTTSSLLQTHHGISCTDIEQTKKVLRAIGFTSHQPGAPEPLTYRNVDDDYIGQITAAVLGDIYHTHYVENPVTGQQIDLIEISTDALSPRDWSDPAQGDLIIGIQVDDPTAAFTAMQAADDRATYSAPVPVASEQGIMFDWRDGQRSILTTAEPFAIVHYSSSDFPTARRFYEEVLDIRVEKVSDARYRLKDIGGRVDLLVSPTTRRLEFSKWGKHYAGANHFRLIEQDIERITRRFEETQLGGFVIPPMGAFAFLHGPTGETIETFDRNFDS
jgi:extradiol dioxygenase family protein